MTRWGSAKVEFQALAPEINRRIDGGETLKSIYEDLRGAGRVTMSLAAFYKNKKAHDGVLPKGRSPAARRSGVASLPLSSPSLPAATGSAVSAALLPTADASARRPAAPADNRLKTFFEGEDAADGDEPQHEREDA